MLSRSDIRRGLALRLDPLQLLAYEARSTASPSRRVWSRHWFICIARRGDESDWIVTSSKWEWGRERVSGKTGQSIWTDRATFADPDQVWTVPSFFGIRAAAAGVDPSLPGRRNYAAIDFADAAALAA